MDGVFELDGDAGPGNHARANLRLHAKFRCVGGHAFADHRGGVGRQHLRGSFPPQRAGQRFGSIVAVVDFAGRGQFQHRIGIEAGEGRLVLDFQFCLLAPGDFLLQVFVGLFAAPWRIVRPLRRFGRFNMLFWCHGFHLLLSASVTPILNAV